MPAKTDCIKCIDAMRIVHCQSVQHVDASASRFPFRFRFRFRCNAANNSEHETLVIRLARPALRLFASRQSLINRFSS